MSSCVTAYCGREAAVCNYHNECSDCSNTAVKCENHSSEQECRECNNTANYCSDHRNNDCSECGDDSASYCSSCYSNKDDSQVCRSCYTNLKNIAVLCPTCADKPCTFVDSAGNDCKNAPTTCSMHSENNRSESSRRERELDRREAQIADRELAIKREALKLAIEMMAKYDIPNPLRVKSERSFV